MKDETKLNHPSPSIHMDAVQRVVATEAALRLIGKLRDKHGDVMFHQSGGCCDGSSPMCFPSGELLLGPNDLLLGELDGCPFYIDADQYERWNSPALVLDVAPGAGSGMSLEGVHDLHFHVNSPPVAAACAAPSPTA